MSSLKRFRSIDPRIALALSGEFRPECDPEGRAHNLGFLTMATVEKGVRAGQVYRYSPSWSPVRTSVLLSRSYEHLYLGIFGPGQDMERLRVPELRVEKKNLEMINITALGITSEEGIDMFFGNVSQCARAKANIAEVASEYFARFDGWEEDEGGVWVPPIAEPADGSER